ncbi:MAG: hypothetical protein ACYC0P_06755 [Thiobacillus sp.]
MSIHTLLLILLVIAGVGAVIADIRSADRALFFRMQNWEDA